MQPGSFDAVAFSNCLHQIPLKAGGYAAAEHPALDKLCTAASLSIRSSPESWSFTLLTRCAHGLAVTYNPGVHIHMSPDSQPPSAWREPSEAAAELLELLWMHIAQSPQFDTIWSGSATHMNAYGMASVAHMGAAGSTEHGQQAWEQTQKAWVSSAHASYRHARGDDVARQVCSSALVHCTGALPHSEEALRMSMQAVAGGKLQLSSSACASLLWGAASLHKAGALPVSSPGSMDGFVSAMAANVKGIRHTIRPLDFGLIAWGLQQLNADSVDPLVFPLLREQADSDRIGARLGGKNAVLAEQALSAPVHCAPLGDQLAVRTVSEVNSQPFSVQQVSAPWPYAEQHVGALGVVGV